MFTSVLLHLVHFVKFRFSIVTGSQHPIYKQLVDQVKLAVSDGLLAPGEQMPSVRSVAETLLINPNTVARAYGDLVKEGVLESQHGRGAFVSGRQQALIKSERIRRLKPHLETFINEARMLGFSPEEITEMIQKQLSKNNPTKKGNSHA